MAQYSERKPLYKKWWFWLIVIIFIGLIANIGDDGETTRKQAELEEEVKDLNKQLEECKESSSKEEVAKLKAQIKKLKETNSDLDKKLAKYEKDETAKAKQEEEAEAKNKAEQEAEAKRQKEAQAAEEAKRKAEQEAQAAEAKRQQEAQEAEAKRQEEQEAQEAAQSSNTNVSYENCSAVRAAGAAPIHQGEPGYARHLDRDGDGIGCDQ